MNPAKFDEAIRAAGEVLPRTKGVRAVVLFGSTARGTATDDSDIDLLVDCPEEKEDEVWAALLELDKRHDVSFSVIFYRRRDRRKFDAQFLESIIRHGRALYGSMPSLSILDLDLQPLRLVSYQADHLSSRRRARLLRAIDGYRTKKRVGRKRYVMEKNGFLKDSGGWRVGRGAVIVPEEAAVAFDQLLREFGAKRSMVAIWCQRP